MPTDRDAPHGDGWVIEQWQRQISERLAGGDRIVRHPRGAICWQSDIDNAGTRKVDHAD